MLLRNIYRNVQNGNIYMSRVNIRPLVSLQYFAVPATVCSRLSNGTQQQHQQEQHNVATADVCTNDVFNCEIVYFNIYVWCSFIIITTHSIQLKNVWAVESVACCAVDVTTVRWPHIRSYLLIIISVGWITFYIIIQRIYVFVVRMRCILDAYRMSIHSHCVCICCVLYHSWESQTTVLLLL